MRKNNFFIGFYNIANFLTLTGLLFALSSCFFAIAQNLSVSIIFFVLSGICDLFDGMVARKIERTNTEKEFGVQLDTVVDVVNFGVTPALIVFSCVSTAWYSLVIYSFYLIAAIVRLAYFNTTAAPNEVAKYYQGLPVTYIALILPIVLLFNSMWASIITLAVVGSLFVLNFKIPKPHGIWYILFPIIAVALMLLWSFL